FLRLHMHPRLTLFPYTTLFRSGSGRDLHAHATRLAHFVLRECGVEAAAHVPAIHARAIVEAFPNLFLGVLCDEADYPAEPHRQRDRKSTRLNSSHVAISYAVLC